MSVSTITPRVKTRTPDNHTANASVVSKPDHAEDNPQMTDDDTATPSVALKPDPNNDDPYGMNVEYMKHNKRRREDEEEKKKNRPRAENIESETKAMKTALGAVLGKGERSILHKFCAQLYLKPWFPIDKERELKTVCEEQLKEFREEYDARFELVKRDVLDPLEPEAKKEGKEE